MIRSVAALSLFCLAALPASAQAVSDWQARTDGFSSVDTIECRGCPPIEAEPVDDMVSLHEEGIRIFEVEGETLAARTDDMMGGSPVTTVISADLLFGPRIATARSPGTGTPRAELPQPAIDRQAQTSSLDAGLAVEDLELRLN